MTKEKLIEIEKTNLEKIIEFFHAIRIVGDARKLISEGRYYHITSIYGQLRALLTDKTKEHRKEPKPIFEIASLLGEDLNIYYLPDTLEQKLPEQERLVLYVSSLPISLKKQTPNQKQISLEDYLNLDIVRYKDKRLKAGDIVNAMSNKYGGAHYDSKVPEYLAQLTSFGINGQHILDNLIIQIADLFLDIGLKLVRKLTDFEFYFTIYFDSLVDSKNENFIFDYTLPSTNCRISFYTFQSTLRVFLCDLVGRSVNLEINEVVPCKELILVNISHGISDELQSRVTVSINGLKVLDTTIQEPLIMLNQVGSFQGYFNRSREQELQDFEFGIGEIVMFGNILEDIKKAELYLHFSETETEKLVYYDRQSYGHSSPGTTDLEMVGNVKLKDFPINGA